jgi:hypothetical protein
MDLTIHVTHHFVGTPDQRLDELLTQVRAMHAQGAHILMATAEVKLAMGRIDAATTAIAAKLTALLAKIGTGMSDADVAEVTAGLEAEASKLEGIAADPDNPVPPAA